MKEKARIVRRYLKDHVELANLAEETGTSPRLILQWAKQSLEGLGNLFQRDPPIARGTPPAPGDSGDPGTFLPRPTIDGVCAREEKAAGRSSLQGALDSSGGAEGDSGLQEKNSFGIKRLYFMMLDRKMAAVSP